MAVEKRFCMAMVAENGNVILRLRPRAAGLAVRAEIVAQSRERMLVEKTGQMIGTVRNEFLAAHSGEKVEELAVDAFGAHFPRSLSKRRMRKTKRSPVSPNSGDMAKGDGIRWIGQQQRK
jgi:hypothetical protein